MTDAALIEQQFEKALDADYDCSITCVTYKGVAHADGRPDKSIHLLTSIDANGDQIVVLVGDKGKRGPTLLKIGGPDDVKTFKSNAFFSLKGAGYEKGNTTTKNETIGSAWDLWYKCFNDHHRDSLLAKRTYLQLLGVDTGSSFETVMSKAGAVKVGPPKKPNPADAYQGNPLYGML